MSAVKDSLSQRIAEKGLPPRLSLIYLEGFMYGIEYNKGVSDVIEEAIQDIREKLTAEYDSDISLLYEEIKKELKSEFTNGQCKPLEKTD